MRLSPIHLVLAIAVSVAPTVMAGQQDSAMERVGQKARPDIEAPGAPVFPIDLPSMPPQEQPVLLAQADQAQQRAAANERILGVCHPVPNAIAPEGARVEYVIDPSYSAQDYFYYYEYREVSGKAEVTVLQGPKHGTLQRVTAANVATIGPGKYVEGSNLYAYFPDTGYIGDDRATILVNFGGQTVKVVYFFKSLDHPLGNTGLVDECAKTGLKWKISQDANGNPVLTATKGPGSINS